MDIQITDDETIAVVERLAELKNKSAVAAIREAVENEYERECRRDKFMRGIKEIQDQFAKLGEPTGLKADKEFYDELSGEDELTGIP
jgi:antitoxin VapB